MAWWEKYEAVGKTTAYNSKIAEARLNHLVFKTSFNPDNLIPVREWLNFTVMYNWIKLNLNIVPDKFEEFKSLITRLVWEYHEKYSWSWWFYSTESVFSNISDKPIFILNIDDRYTEIFDTTVFDSDKLYEYSGIKPTMLEWASKKVMVELARFLNEIVKTPKSNDNHDSQTPQLQIVSW